MRKRWYRYLNHKGISLPEILITIVIVGLLTAIGLPHYQKSQRKGMQSEAKVLLSGLYAKERTFVDEWGYGTPNFHQLGYFPSGNFFYNAGWAKTGSVTGDDINEVYSGDPLNPGPHHGEYEGPYLPSDLSIDSLNYDVALAPAKLKEFTNVKEFCKSTGVFKGVPEDAPCIFNPTAASDPKFDIPGTETLQSIGIQIDNTKAPNPDEIEFNIGARAHFSGAPQSDEWVITKHGRLKNVQVGL